MKRLAIIVGALALGAPVGAQAQDDWDILKEKDRERRLEVRLNGGVGGYLGDVGEVTGSGPAYGVTATLNPDKAISYELGYIGHSNPIEGFDGRLSSNKLQVGIKAGPELRAPVPWRPYAYAGLAADLVRSGSAAFGLSNGTQGVVPLGVGADFFTDSAIRVGARALYDFAPGVGSSISPNDPSPDGWQALLNAQAVF